MDFITDFDEENRKNSNETELQIKPSTIIAFNRNNNNSVSNIHFISKNKREELAQQKSIKQKTQEEKHLQDIQRKKRLFINPKNLQRNLNPVIIKDKNKDKAIPSEKDELKEIKVIYSY